MFFVIIPARSSYRPSPPSHTGLAHPVIPAKAGIHECIGSGVSSVIARVLDPGLGRGDVKSPANRMTLRVAIRGLKNSIHSGKMNPCE